MLEYDNENESYEWTCPLCSPKITVASFNRDEMHYAIARHIKLHEMRAQQSGADDARLSCRSSNCEAGHNRHWDETLHSWVYDFTAFDKRLMREMKISLDDQPHPVLLDYWEMTSHL